MASLIISMKQAEIAQSIHVKAFRKANLYSQGKINDRIDDGNR